MGGLVHQLIHPTNAGRRPALTPVAIAVAVLGAMLVLVASADAAERNVSAAAAQYPVAASQQGTAPDDGAAIPLGEETPPTGDAVPTEPTQVVAPATADTPGTSGASPRARGEFRLPFTGYVVLPLLIAGAMLLVTGFAVRRRVSGQPA